MVVGEHRSFRAATADSAPPPAPAYHPAFDRGVVDTGQGPWHHAAPDGVIDLPNDVLGVLLQFGTDCN